MIILGIETSCDETAAAVACGKGDNVEIVSSIVASQINIHRKYGGVIPEVAAREHVMKILPVIHKAIEESGISKTIKNNKCSKFPIPNSRFPAIDAIAVTYGPGLITSLMVGIETAKTLSYVWKIPLVAVNHLEAHIYANYIRKIPNSKFPIPNSKDFPAIVLIVSGGHTSLILMSGHGKYKTIGETADDAAGEAFDKAAKLLGVGYPGGPEISKLAEKYISSKLIIQNPRLTLPRPMINSGNYNFSFSGLKTALLYKLRADKNWKNKIPEYAYEFQQAAVDVLVAKTIRAGKQYKAKTIMLAGGVSANNELRKQMGKAVLSGLPNSRFLIPSPEYCTDNAAMVAAAGYFKARKKNYADWQKLKVDCNATL